MKAKVFKKKIGNKDLNDIFNVMIGNADASPTIIEPKYDSLLNSMKLFMSTFEIFHNSDFCQKLLLDGMNCRQEFTDFLKYKDFLDLKTLPEEKHKMRTNFSGNLMEDLYELGCKYDPVKLNITYKDLKNSELLDHIFKTLDNIKSLLYEDKQKYGGSYTCLDVPNDLSNRFFIKTNLSTKLFSWSGLDFNFMYTFYSSQENDFNRLVLLVLHKMYLYASNCYETYMEPDIDIDQFVSSFKEQIDAYSKTVNECGEAFGLLKKSLGLLRKNFKEYHKRFMTTKQPNIIFDSYICDIASKNKHNRIALAQFRKLIRIIYEKLPPEMKKDTRFDTLFSYSEKFFEELDKAKDQN